MRGISRLSLAALALLVVLLGSGCTDAAERKLRIVTWNLEWFPGGRPGATPEEAAKKMAAAQKALVELKPDVLLLQEVKDWAAASELCSVLPKLQVQVASRFQPWDPLESTCRHASLSIL